MKRPLISRESFAALKPGEIIMVNGTPRTVISPPNWKNFKHCSALSITLAIMRRSWTNRAYTTTNWNDLKHKTKRTGKFARGPILKSELARLNDLEFDARKELRREIDERKQIAYRTGKALCAGIPRLEKLT